MHRMALWLRGSVIQMCEVQRLVRAGAGFSSALACALSSARGSLCTVRLVRLRSLAVSCVLLHLGTSLFIHTTKKKEGTDILLN